jgi:hypothetical protein
MSVLFHQGYFMLPIPKEELIKRLKTSPQIIHVSEGSDVLQAIKYISKLAEVSAEPYPDQIFTSHNLLTKQGAQDTSMEVVAGKLPVHFSALRCCNVD